MTVHYFDTDERFQATYTEGNVRGKDIFFSLPHLAANAHMPKRYKMRAPKYITVVGKQVAVNFYYVRIQSIDTGSKLYYYWYYIPALDQPENQRLGIDYNVWLHGTEHNHIPTVEEIKKNADSIIR